MRQFFAIFLMIFLAGTAARAQEEARAENPLAPFEALMGTWSGEGTNRGEPVSDVTHIEWILGGHAVQQTHAVNGGTYGGRTIYFWDREAAGGEGAIIYHYFTTAGFHTQGTAYWEDGAFHATEAVEGHPTITEVRATMTPDGEGGWNSTSEYLDSGEWVPGHEFHYVATPGAVITFPGN